jgi:hypothetical protein
MRANLDCLLRACRRSACALTLVMVSAVSLSVSDVKAQSAADKATARELASDGVRRLKNGDAAGALVKLEKAQALYDAPIHLLYIARAHVELGHLVEGAETYRVLLRAKLADDAPAVFHEAQRDGEKELEALEPRVGRLTIEVVPDNVTGLSVAVDGKSVNVAALGVPRATNPGHHLIVVEAPGYERAEREVDLPEGKNLSASITLIQAEGQIPPPPSDEKDEKADDSTPKEEGNSDKSSWESGPYGFIVGAKVAAMIPLGELEKGTPMSDYFRTGGAARLELGFRFLRYIGIKAFLGGALLSYGDELKSYAGEFVDGASSQLIAKQGDVGASLLFTADPRKMGGFGEIGMSFAHAYAWKQVLNGGQCESIAEYSGWGGHVGAGVNVPLTQVFTLVPYAEFGLGQLKRRAYEYGCAGVYQEQHPDEDEIYPDKTERSLDPALHYQILLGVGGDFHFGDDWFR